MFNFYAVRFRKLERNLMMTFPVLIINGFPASEWILSSKCEKPKIISEKQISSSRLFFSN